MCRQGYNSRTQETETGGPLSVSSKLPRSIRQDPDSRNNTCENLFLMVHINYESIWCIIKWFRNGLLKKSPLEELKTYSKLLFT